MAEQVAAIFSPVEQVDGAWQPVFVSVMQNGERYSGSIEFLPNGVTLPVVKDFVPGDSDLVTAAGITICYVWADETRITTANGLSQYHVLWRMYSDPEASDTAQMPDDNMTGAELSAILSYLATNTPYSETAITNWVINKFDVETQQQAVNWSTSRPRYRTVNKLMQAMQIWAQAKAELDVL